MRWSVKHNLDNNKRPKNMEAFMEPVVKQSHDGVESIEYELQYCVRPGCKLNDGSEGVFCDACNLFFHRVCFKKKGGNAIACLSCGNIQQAPSA